MEKKKRTSVLDKMKEKAKQEAAEEALANNTQTAPEQESGRTVITGVKGGALGTKRKRTATKQKVGCKDRTIVNLPTYITEEYKELQDFVDITVNRANFNQFAIDAIEKAFNQLKKKALKARGGAGG